METNQEKPKNYLVESILVTLFCCLPFGIVAIIKASKVNNAYDSGNYEGANQSSLDAKKWMRYALIGGAIYYIIAIIFLFVAGGLALFENASY